MTNCILENSLFFTIGVGLGVTTALLTKKKNYNLFFLSVAVGTTADFAYGYNVQCKQLVDDFKKAKSSTSLDVRPPKDPEESK